MNFFTFIFAIWTWQVCSSKPTSDKNTQTQTQSETYPNHVVLVLAKSGFFVCEGVLIDKGDILTAAGCVEKYMLHPKNLEVIVNATSTENLNSDKNIQRRSVSSIKIPRRWFDSGKRQSNIALLKVSTPFASRSSMKPASWGRKTEPNQTLKLIGYGTKEKLEAVPLKVSSKTESECETSDLLQLVQEFSDTSYAGAPLIASDTSANQASIYAIAGTKESSFTMISCYEKWIESQLKAEQQEGNDAAASDLLIAEDSNSREESDQAEDSGGDANTTGKTTASATPSQSSEESSEETTELDESEETTTTSPTTQQEDETTDEDESSEEYDVTNKPTTPPSSSEEDTTEEENDDSDESTSTTPTPTTVDSDESTDSGESDEESTTSPTSTTTEEEDETTELDSNESQDESEENTSATAISQTTQSYSSTPIPSSSQPSSNTPAGSTAPPTSQPTTAAYTTQTPTTQPPTTDQAEITTEDYYDDNDDKDDPDDIMHHESNQSSGTNGDSQTNSKPAAQEENVESVSRNSASTRNRPTSILPFLMSKVGSIFGTMKQLKNFLMA